MTEKIIRWGQQMGQQHVEPAIGTRIYFYGSYWAESLATSAPTLRLGTYLGNDEVEVESVAKFDGEVNIKQASVDLREIASRIHCPNTTGGQMAAGIKAEIEAVADDLLTLP